MREWSVVCSFFDIPNLKWHTCYEWTFQHLKFFRNIRLECSIKTEFLKFLQNPQKKTFVSESHFNGVKGISAQVFSSQFVKFLRVPFPRSTFRGFFWLLWVLQVYCVYLKSIALYTFLSPSSSSASLPHFLRNIRELGAKKYFTDHRIATRIQLFVAIKGNFSGLFFF